MKFKQLPKGPYKPNDFEEDILKYWLDNKYYKPETSETILRQQVKDGIREKQEEGIDKFSLINPPPNAYARPHIGNVSGYAYQDVFARRARLQGKKTLMFPGKDHAAQQAEIVYIRDVLSKKGQSKEYFTREEFYNNAYEYFTRIAEIAQNDEKRIGLSADFDRDMFTLDPRAHATVMRTFEKLWRDKMVYKGVRIVNWSPGLNSAVADIDTERKTVQSKFYYIKYKFPEVDKVITSVRDKFTKGKLGIDEVKEIPVKAESKKDKKLANRFRHFEINSGKDSYKVWVNSDQYEQIGSGNELEISAIIIPFAGNAQLVVGRKSEEFESYIFAKANEIYGSSFIRWFEEDEKVNDKKELDQLYTRGFIMGTVRPETKFGDTAFAVNPKDERFAEIVGKDMKVVGLNGEVKIKIIANPKVDIAFGTGMVKVTPAHAPTDYEMYLEHNNTHPDDPIGYMNVIGKDSKLNHLAGVAEGMHAEDDREKIADMMKEAGLIVFEEETESNITICERTKTTIQPIMSSQWFIDTDKLKVPALKAIKDEEVKIHPENMTKKLQYWLENLRDWPISRSIWWGYRIPVWYKGEVKEFTDDNGQIAVEIGGVKVDDMQDAIGKGVMKIDLQQGFAPILIPGRKALENFSLYADIKKQYPWAQIVETGTKDQDYEDYKKGFEKVRFDEDSVIVAHSLGAPAVITYLLDNKIKVKTIVFLSPSNEASDNFEMYKKRGIWKYHDQLDKLKEYCERLVVIYSDNDEVYKAKDYEKFIEATSAEGILEKGKQHFFTREYRHDSKELEKLLKQESEAITAEDMEGWNQDEDVFDTWFSSGQWPYVTLEGEGLMDYYPTSVMETGFDILELWVSRMIMLGLYTQGSVPFKNVYLHGLIKGEDGQKMSKSRGNLLYTEDLINEYGADALRMMYIVGNKAGAGYRIDREKLKGYRNFLNKIWNASKFIFMNLEQTKDEKSQDIIDQFKSINLDKISEKATDLSQFTTESKVETTRRIAELDESVDEMMLKSLHNLNASINEHMENFRVGMAAEELYQHFWHVFADIYIEQVKEVLFQTDREGNAINQDEEAQKVRSKALSTLLYSLQMYLKLLHPYIPFLTESLWQHLPEETKESESIMYGVV